MGRPVAGHLEQPRRAGGHLHERLPAIAGQQQPQPIGQPHAEALEHDEPGHLRRARHRYPQAARPHDPPDPGRRAGAAGPDAQGRQPLPLEREGQREASGSRHLPAHLPDAQAYARPEHLTLDPVQGHPDRPGDRSPGALEAMRSTVTIVTAAALSLAVPAAATATTTVSYSPDTGVLIQGDAAGEGAELDLLSGSPDRIEVARSSFQGRTTRATLVVGSGCAAGGTDIDGQNTSVRCQLTANRVVTANLGDGDDWFQDNSFGHGGLFLDGAGGDDVLRGGGAPDLIRGGPGGDELSGGPGAVNDVLEGGDGNDRLIGDGGGTDTIRGGNGSDTLVARAAPPLVSADLFDGGPGVDTADYSARSGSVSLTVSVAAATPADDGRPGESDQLLNVETLIGGSGNDTL